MTSSCVGPIVDGYILMNKLFTKMKGFCFSDLMGRILYITIFRGPRFFRSANFVITRFPWLCRLRAKMNLVLIFWPVPKMKSRKDKREACNGILIYYLKDVCETYPTHKFQNEDILIYLQFLVQHIFLDMYRKSFHMRKSGNTGIFEKSLSRPKIHVD